MKIQKLLLYFLAAGAILAGCREEEPMPTIPSLTVGQSELSFEKGGGNGTLTVTSNRPWSISTDADWLAFNPSEGDASDAAVTVTVTALGNAGSDRVTSFKVKTDFDYKTIVVTQPGEKGADPYTSPTGTGTKDDPYNVIAALKAVENLIWVSNDNYDMTDYVYVKGKISRIADKGTYTEGGTFGNATFWISPDGSTTNEFEVYRALYLGNKKFASGQTDIKVGDEVIIYGKLMNYRGNTPETVSGTSYLYSLNGETAGGGGDAGDPKGTGTAADPYNPAAAIAAVANLTWTSNDNYQTTDLVYVKGKISKIADNGTYTEGGQYGNATFWISEDGGSNGEFYVYRALYLGNKKFAAGQTDIKVGDEVVICGKLMNYRGNTPETVSGTAYLYSLNGEGGGGGSQAEAKGTGTLDDPYNPAAAAAAVANLTWTSNDNYQTTGEVYVKGKISKIADKGTYTDGGQYGNASFYIVEDGTDFEFYVFRALYLGNKKFESGQTDIKVGDEVIICGKLMNYRGNTPETVAGGAFLYSLNGKSEGGGGGGEQGGGDVTPKGSGTLNDPYNPAAAAAAVANLTWTSNDDYQTTDVVYVKGKISSIANKGTFTEGGTYGNASFYISEDGSSDGTFYVFRTLYLGNQKYESGQTDIKVGDEVIICGKLMNYRGNTPETVAGSSYLYSLNGKSEGGEGGGEEQGDGTPKGSGTLNDPYNPAAAAAAVANLTWTSNDDYQSTDVVYVKGKISSIANKGTFTDGGTYGNASFYISEDGSSDGTFYVFRTLYLGNKKFESGQTDIKVGDEVVICGKLMNYRGNTPETVAGSSYLYSLNGKTEPGEGGGEQGGGEQGGEGGQPAGGGSVVTGNVETVTFSNCGLSNGTQYKVINGTNVKISFGDGGNDGKYYNTGTGMRIYGNGHVQFDSEKTITKVVYTFQNDKSDTAPFYPTEGSYSINEGTISLNGAVATWTGSSKSIKLTRPNGNGHWRLQKVEVTFAE